jgi:hypothetical protein
MKGKIHATCTTNVIAWVKECRRRNSNTIANTYTGKWLDAGLRLIENQYHNIQEIRNSEISRHGDIDNEEAAELLKKLDSIQGGKFQVLAFESASMIRKLLRED